MNITDQEHARILGMLTAQSYMLEALLLGAITGAADPSAAAETLTRRLEIQILSDHSANLSLTPAQNLAEPAMVSAVEYVSMMRDRLLGQFENPSPASTESH